MLPKQLSTCLASYKFKAHFKKLINFHNSRPTTFYLHTRFGLPLRSRRLNTDELKNGLVNNEEAMLILNVSNSKVKTSRVETSAQSSVKKKTRSKAKNQLVNDQISDLAYQDTQQSIVEISRSETPSKLKVVKCVSKIKPRRIQSSGKTIETKPEGVSVTSIRKTFSDRKDFTLKTSVNTEIQKVSDTVDLPADWKNILLNILNNAETSNDSERAVLTVLNKALSSSRSKIASKNQGWQQNVSEIETLDTTELPLVPIHSGDLNVPRLSYGLDRVLFNHGVYQLQDPRTRVFNFDPYLREIMPIAQFDFNALSQYITSSRDVVLREKASEEKKKYVGSTSSMTDTLSHFHFLLSNWRPIEYGNLSGNMPSKLKACDYTAYSRAPVAIFLRYRDGSYAIDADKEFETNNVLAMLGKAMEKLLTLSSEDFERYRRENSDQLSEEERNKRDSYHYTTCGDFLLRSQLDAYDPRLPGTGMFDLKTRCVISVRMDVSEYESSKTYEIRKIKGEWESYEREYYDMIRAAFLKYSMQVRMGRMDGIFVAFHNTTRIFGFQYISLEEMDFAIHGTDNLKTGNEEYKLSLGLLNKVFDRATAKFPKKTLRFFFETQKLKNNELTYMNIVAQPLEEEEVERIQNKCKERMEVFERKIMGVETIGSDVDEDITERKLNSGSEVEEDEVEHSSYIPRWDGMEYRSEGMMWDTASMEQRITEDLVDGEIIDEDMILEQESMKMKNSTSCEKNSMKMIEETVHKDEDLREEQEIEESAATSFQEEEGNFESLEIGRPSSRHRNREEEPPDEYYTKPFLAMKLVCQNKVNDHYVERPENLTEDDKWSIEYRLTEYAEGRPSINIYQDMKNRRKVIYTSKLDLDPNKPTSSHFERELRKYIEKGRIFREQENEIESKLTTQIFGMSPSPPTELKT
ncbi:putative mrna degradation protein [Golovinomyces cichoracearum]|uniref:Putative mrna degradation protein n=1 Tax=Golovinomyces cichoracearum TaxID=62708 RepID=A0A420HLH8_9PEZI|nr:putative mrna degradation protein [Golovinomyces cichoracearum]